MNPSDDPYEILGIQPGTDDKEIKKVYRKLAMKFHPDKQTTDEERERAHDMFSKISAAYEVVSNPSQRHELEMNHASGGGGGGNHVGGGRRRPSRRFSNQTPPRTRSTQSPPTKQRSTNCPPPPSSPGLFRSRPKRAGSPSKPRETSPSASIPRPIHRRSSTAPHSPGSLRGIVGNAPQSPGALRHRKHKEAPTPSSPGTLRQHHPHHHQTHQAQPRSATTLTPPSPGSIRPQGRPRPRPVGVGGNGAAPRKHNSTGTLRNGANRASTGSLSPRPGPDGDPAPRRQMSTGTLRRKFRDPFLIFEEVMEEEYGKGYKTKAASGWNKDEHGNVSGGGGKNQKKPRSAKKEFQKLDLNGDQALSKSELRQFIESNEELWAILGAKLDLKRETCIRIATEVAFRLAKGDESVSPVGGNGKKRRSTSTANNNNNEVSTYELSESEFKAFYKNYVLSQKGSYEFFLRTIFAFYDINGDGVLQRDEFENFLDLFYKTKENYKQRMSAMPSKQKLLRIAEARLDKNKDGELSFDEVRALLQVAVVVTADGSEK